MTANNLMLTDAQRAQGVLAIGDNPNNGALVPASQALVPVGDAGPQTVNGMLMLEDDPNKNGVVAIINNGDANAAG